MSNVDFVKGVYAAFGPGDVPKVPGPMQPQIRWTATAGRKCGGHGGADDARAEVARLVESLVRQGIGFTAIDTRQSSLEDIFVDLLEQGA